MASINKYTLSGIFIQPESDDCYGAIYFDPFVYRACTFMAISPIGYGPQSRKPDKLKGSV